MKTPLSERGFPHFWGQMIALVFFAESGILIDAYRTRFLPKARDCMIQPDHTVPEFAEPITALTTNLRLSSD